MAAQHPSSTSPFYHFSSSHFRTEGGDQVKDVHNLFADLMSNLSRASKRQYLDKFMEFQKLERRVEEQDKVIEEQSRTGEEKDKQIALLLREVQQAGSDTP